MARGAHKRARAAAVLPVGLMSAGLMAFTAVSRDIAMSGHQRAKPEHIARDFVESITLVTSCLVTRGGSGDCRCSTFNQCVSSTRLMFPARQHIIMGESIFIKVFVLNKMFYVESSNN